MIKIANKLKYALLIIFAVFYIETAIFSHVHIIRDKIISHSHPYSDTTENHTHTSDEISLISQLSLLIGFSLLTFFALNRATVLQISKLFYSDCLQVISSHTTRQLRAPPVL